MEHSARSLRAPRNSVWAVGIYIDGAANHRTLIEHWDGARWTQVRSPNPGGPIGAMPGQNSLTSVAVVSPSSAWAVGSYTAPYQCCSVSRTLILHWNGHGWKQITSPNAGGPGFRNNGLSGVSAGAGNAWAVGSYWNGSAPRTLALHWNGRAWTRVPSPNPSVAPYADDLRAVAVLSPSRAVAVGLWTQFAGSERTFVLRWNGRSWTQLISPDPGGSQVNHELVAVAGNSCANLWAVGDYSGNNPWITRSVTARC